MKAAMYRSVTHGVQVTVEARFVAEESQPDDGRWFWAYQIEILNLGHEDVRLRTRHWRITDAAGRTQEVRGAGVVGEQPLLKPGEAFTYTSGCPLPTPSGIMVGSYGMEGASGAAFDVAIPAFSLDSPDEPRTLN